MSQHVKRGTLARESRKRSAMERLEKHLKSHMVCHADDIPQMTEEEFVAHNKTQQEEFDRVSSSLKGQRMAYVNIDIDPDDVLNKLSTDDIIDYLEDDRGIEVKKEDVFNIDILVNAYFHGDFDIRALLRKIGSLELKKIMKNI